MQSPFIDAILIPVEDAAVTAVYAPQCELPVNTLAAPDTIRATTDLEGNFTIEIPNNNTDYHLHRSPSAQTTTAEGSEGVQLRTGKQLSGVHRP